MAFDYKKLIADLRAAKAYADEAVAEYTFNDGADNFDSVFLRIPRIKEEKVLSWIRSIGLSAYKSNWLGPGYMIDPGHMRSKRSIAAVKMVQYLKAHGYDVINYYRLD